MVLILAAIPLVVWDFSVSDQAFVSGGDIGQWAWGVPTSGPAGSDTVWGTNLDGNYFNDATETLEIPPIDVTGATRPVLVIRHFFDIQPGDFGIIEVDDGGGFARVEPIFGYPDAAGFTGGADWADVSVDLSGFGNTPRVRFVFSADAALAGDGWYLQGATLYDGDATPPLVSPMLVPIDTQELAATYAISLLAIDDVAVTAIDLFVRFDGGPETVLAFSDSGGGVWDAEIPAQLPDTDVSWYAIATDGTQSTRYPQIGTLDFRVFLAAPQNLRGPDDNRLVGTEVLLTWDAPNSPHAVLSYEVMDAENILEVTGFSATMPVLENAPAAWTVTAIYGAGAGDASEVLSLDVEVPALDFTDPDSAFQGESVRVQFQGSSLYLFEEISIVDFGAGIEVTELVIRDVDAGSAILTVSDGASVGLRDVRITGTEGAFSFADAFEVRDGADAPKILEVTPTFGIQGEDLTVTVLASEAYAGDLAVEGGDDLVVTRATTDGDVARVTLVINNSAHIGIHTLVLDDGVRLWTAEFEVKERIFVGSTGCQGCATRSSPSGLWMFLLLLIGARRGVAGR